MIASVQWDIKKTAFGQVVLSCPYIKNSLTAVLKTNQSRRFPFEKRNIGGIKSYLSLRTRRYKEDIAVTVFFRHNPTNLSLSKKAIFTYGDTSAIKLHI